MSLTMGNIDPSLLALAARGLELAFNEALRYDPASKQRIALLEQKSCLLHFEDQQLSLGLRVDQGHCYLSLIPLQTDLNADLILSGQLSSFQKLAREAKHSLAGSGVHAQGDIALLQSVAELSANIDIDWQDALAAKAGPELAAVLATVIKTFRSQLPSIELKQSKAHLSKLLHTEWRLAPHPEELLHFQTVLMQTRRDTERFAARLDILKAQLGSDIN